MKIQQRAYILHRRQYRNNSLILEFLTQQHGIVSAVCKGLRNNPKQRGIVSFVPLWLEYSVRDQLASIHKIEPYPHLVNLSGNQLYCGLYLNELLLKLLGKHDAYPELFNCYQQTLSELASSEELEKPLRKFELKLLSEIGYGIPFAQAANTHLPIVPQKYYYYQLNHGFNEIIAESSPQEEIWNGAIINAIAQQRFDEVLVLKAAKYILRMTIDNLLGNRSLNSRRLFMKK